MTPPEITTGLYRHYKGQHYRVLGVARHSETQDWLVLYRALYGDHGLWVRPAAMFTQSVEIDGRTQPRFALERAQPDIDDMLQTPRTAANTTP